ncbi:MAG: redox-regulated ATPase YchF [Bacteroidales bacterium]|nr:redox-regulated ATPase YchF [Bacteroidales bacterium]
MGLKCGVIGLTNTGKTTIFNCISKSKAEITNFAFSATKSNIGMIDVPDQRLYEIDKYIHSAKIVPATVEIVDLPGLAKGASKGEGVGNKFLADVQQTDALIHVLRCFDDENLAHVEGSINPVRDIELVDFELQVRDLELVERKIQRLEKAAKSAGDKDAKQGMEVLQKYADVLGNLGNARDVVVDRELHDKYVRDMLLLTEKPVMYVCNVDDESAVNGNKYSDAVKEAFKDKNVEILIVAGKLEAEIADLEDDGDRAMFLEDAGLTEPGVNRMIRTAYDMLNLQSFFTAGPMEVKAWTITKGTTAPQAAGVIHSDLERGFIRAEVMHYDDFITLKSEVACKEKGKLFIEGKTYVMEDGDIIHIRFNV